jgi:hypothetical protein
MLGMPAGTVRASAAGERRPDDLLKVAHAVVAVARNLGLGGAGGDSLVCCRWLPAEIVRARRFGAMAAIALGLP